MNVREAVAKAKAHVREVFQDEDIRNVGLEEVEYEESPEEWVITIGFSRSWNDPRNPLAALQPEFGKRSYKVVRLRNEDGQLISVKNREFKT